MNRFLNNQNGIALIMVIILLVAVGSLVGVLMTSEVFNISFTGREINKTKAFYLAEAGVQRVDALFNKYGKSIFEDDNSLTGEDDEFINQQNLMSLDNYDGSYQITDIEKIESENKVEIEILGKYNNAKKILGITIDLANEIDLDGLFSNALFASGNPDDDTQPAVSLSGGAKINGTVVSNVQEFDDFEFSGGSQINGDILVNVDELNNPPEDTWEADKVYKVDENGNKPIVWYNGMKYIQNNWTHGDEPDENSTGLYDKWIRAIPKFNEGDQLKYTEKKKYPEAVFPSYPDELEDRGTFDGKKENWLIEKDGDYNQIKVDKDNTLTIDMKNGDRTIRVKNLNIRNGHIELINKSEDSKLTFYVDNVFSPGTNNARVILNKNGNPDDVMIYYAGNQGLVLQNDTEINGSIFVKKADVTFEKGSKMRGNLISNGDEVTFSGGSAINNGVVYALNADVSLLNGGKVTGSVIAKTFEASGGTSIMEHTDEFDYLDIFNDILDYDNSGRGNSSGENDKIIWYNK